MDWKTWITSYDNYIKVPGIITKNSNPTFEQIIRTLCRDTGNIEASFSSKMLATPLVPDTIKNP